MVYSIIGTGNIAWLLATKLSAAGHTCSGIYGRNQSVAAELTDIAGGIAYKSLSDIGDDMDCCIIAVSDNAIGEVAAQLSLQQVVLIHTAGAVDTDILSEAAKNYGVLWPIYSIIKNDLPQHRNIPLAWEASTTKAADVIKQVADSFSDNLLMLENEKRKWLHLTAVIGNNFTNHLFAVCEKICAEKGIPFTAVLPIIQQTIGRLDIMSPLDTQTGPARRGDKTIIDRHLEMLNEYADWAGFYKTISTSIEKMYNQ